MHNDLYRLAEQLGQHLYVRGEVVITAESCTGGWIAQAITEVPGSSAWFDRGFVTYSNVAKVQMLGVRPETLDRFGAVSAETVKEMVVGALKHCGADWAIAVTGIAGPGEGQQRSRWGQLLLPGKVLMLIVSFFVLNFRVLDIIFEPV